MLLLLWPPPPELPPIGTGIPLLPPLEPEEPLGIPPGIPGMLTGMFNPVPPGILIVPKGGKLDSSNIETSPPMGIPDVDMLGLPERPLFPLLPLLGPAPLASASKMLVSGSNWAIALG